ncbi:MAG: FliM/FliN family flagellar motor switch protein [Chromatiales bacterium]|nr:FliM/FliN family flagellar motor switch protein [Chromatiales bacterium]
MNEDSQAEERLNTDLEVGDQMNEDSQAEELLRTEPEDETQENGETSTENPLFEEQDATSKDIDTPDSDQSMPERDPLSDEPPASEPPPTAAAEITADHWDNLDMQQDSPKLNGLDELPLELLFVADKFTVSLNELKQFKPGYVLELNKQATGQVDIHANGVLVGRGELVQIENRAGVRILNLYHQEKADG